MRKPFRSLTATALYLSLLPVDAHAQEANPAPAQDSETSADGGEIVVTALRRDTLLQDTPVSIAAVTGDTLQEMGATGLQDYFRQIPNLNMSQGGLGQNRISIRGVRSAGEATVGTYYGETPITGLSGTTQDAGGGQADLNLFDVERVELLRGPQGTLYGSSSMGGTIRILFKKPDATKIKGSFEGQVSTVAGGSTGFFGKAAVNVPVVTDLLAVRVAAYHEERPGFIDGLTVGGKNFNRSRANGVRALVGFTPTPDLEVIATGIYQESKAANQQGWYEPLGDYKTNSRVVLPFENELKLFSVTANWALEGVTLTATGSTYRYDVLRVTDFTDSYVNLASNAAACRRYLNLASACSATDIANYRQAVLGMLPITGWQPGWLKAESAEIRAASNGDGIFQWTVGGFYERRRDFIESATSLADPATGETKLPLQNRAYRYLGTNLTQKAVFADATIEPIEGLTVQGGARYFDYSKVTYGENLQGDIIFNSFPIAYSEQGADADGWLTKATVSYKATPSLMLYSSISKGFRPGGANNIPTLPTGLVAYQPDSLWDKEIGVKSSWFGNKLTLNIALFQIDWTNMQTSGRSSDGVFSFITNAGAARIRGAEIEFTARLVTGLSLTGGIGIIDAKLKKDQVNSNTQLTGTTGLKGDRLPGVPRFSGSLSASYSVPVSSMFNGLVRLDYSYTGKMGSSFRAATDPFYETYGKYGLLNARIGLESDSYGLYLFAQNLTNEVAVTSASSSAGVERLLYTTSPRTLGINARFNF